jgi:hypothetical protein
MLLNSLYMAVVDHWRIEKGDEPQDLNSSSLEAIASYLTERDQELLCRIIGRTYVPGEPADEEDDESNLELAVAG